MRIKWIMVNDDRAPGGEIIWTAEKGWHTLPKGVRAVLVVEYNNVIKAKLAEALAEA